MWKIAIFFSSMLLIKIKTNKGKTSEHVLAEIRSLHGWVNVGFPLKKIDIYIINLIEMLLLHFSYGCFCMYNNCWII